MNQPAEGLRFSHVYLTGNELLPDSKKMRRRLGYLYHNHTSGRVKDHLNRELGLALKSAGSANEYYWPAALVSLELSEVLDSITIVYQYLEEVIGRRGSNFLNDVRRVLDEERVRYRVDARGGVHFTVDEAFEKARVSTVRSLADPRYAAARERLEAAYSALDEARPDGKTAIRNVFHANENLFRLIFSGTQQLGAGELRKRLQPKIDARYSSERIACSVAHKQLAQYVSWVEGAHFYRHEPGTEEPAQPPLEIAVQYVTSGTAWLRWLQGFDA